MNDAVNLMVGEDEIVVATMNLPGRAMNVVDDVLVTGISAAANRLALADARGPILTSAKAGFCAGGDLGRM